MNRKLYAYFNIKNPMVAWEVAIGRIRSICDDTETSFGVSLWFYNLLRKYIGNGASNCVINEFKLELERQENFCDKVSRLQGVYFFESKEMAESALDRWKMPQKKKYISEVYFSGNSYTEVDSEWITSYIQSDETSWMKHYWSGKTLGVKPLTEILANGIGVIQDTNLRMMAYNEIIEKWPTCSILLNSCIATFSEAKIENIGQLVPAILKQENFIEGSYFINMKEFDENQDKVIASLSEAKEKGMNLPMILPDNQDKIFSLPDLTCLSFKLENFAAAELFFNIHDS